MGFAVVTVSAVVVHWDLPGACAADPLYLGLVLGLVLDLCPGLGLGLPVDPCLVAARLTGQPPLPEVLLEAALQP